MSNSVDLEHFLLLVIKLVQQEKKTSTKKKKKRLHVNLCNQSPGLAVKKKINEQIKHL